MKAKEFIVEHKKGRRAIKHNLKPRNPMGTAPQTGAGAHRDKKKEQKQGYEKHKTKDVTEDTYIPFDQCPQCGGDIVHESLMNEKQDACYHKVRSRYKVWPSAYASGALVQCRKKGAKNWGNKSK